MSEWKQCKLGEIADVQTGPFGSQLHSADYVQIGIPSIMPTNIGTRLEILRNNIACISDNDAQRLQKYLVKEGDIVYSRRGDVEKCAFITKNESGWLCGTGCLRIRFNTDSVLPQFCAYYLSTDEIKGWVSGNAVGTTMPNLNTTILSRLPLSLPTLNEQKAIAAILSSLDDKIDLLHRQNKTLEAMAETLFRQWFIEEAKADWEIGTLGEVIDIFDGRRIPLSKMERDKRKDGFLYPYYGAAQIMDYINDFIFDGEYILLGEDGTVRTDEGYPVLQLATGKFWVNNHAHVIKAKPPYSNFLIWNYLSKKNIDEVVTGAVQPKISQGNLKSIDFPRYPSNLVSQFNDTTGSFLDKIHQNNVQIQKLENLRNTLLPKLMSGEVRVKS